MTLFKTTHPLTAFILSIALFAGNSFATDLFVGQDSFSEALARALGIERKVFYSSPTDLFAYYSHMESESMKKVDAEEAKAIHDEIEMLIKGFVPDHDPDAIHLHLDHKHVDTGKFDALYDKFQQKAEELGLTVTERENSNASPSQYPPIQRSSMLEIMLAEPEVMAKFIDYAITTYYQYLASEQLSSADSCLFVHPQYTPDEDDPAEQYLFHYRSDIMLSNPASCAVSHDYAINLRDRLKTKNSE